MNDFDTELQAPIPSISINSSLSPQSTPLSLGLELPPIQTYNNRKVKPSKMMQDSCENPTQKESDIYKRIKLLGTGSYGRAFLVKEISTQELWVIKQINLAQLSGDEQQAAMKQAKILELLKHHNIVRFKEVYRTAKGKLNIVMEYAEGGDLSHRIKAAKQTSTHFSQDQILNWFVQICLGIKHLHDRYPHYYHSKVIHRDLKSQNIFLTHQSLVKIGDFGVAKIMENTVARAKTFVGSPYYLSPEIVESRPYSFKTDIWSLGTLLFELCALHPPFSAANLQSLALKIVQGSYVQIPKQYSDGLRNLIKWLLQTKQAHRPNINQIILSPIIATRINRFISESQRLQQKSDIVRGPVLKPPPDLIALENGENRSEVIVSKHYNKEQEEEQHFQIKAKAKTPQIAVKKCANNFFNRPASNKRKVENNNDLADLIQIKPSLIEMHEKPEKLLIPLPKVPLKPKQKPQPVIQTPIPLPKTSNSAFVKKRTSFTQLEGIKKEQSKSNIIVSGRRSEVKKVENPSKQEKSKVEPKKQPMKKEEKKKSQIKPQIRKKTSKPIASQTKLQICSQQMKKKEMVVVQPQKKKQKPAQKRPTTQMPPRPPQIMQQQKCNSQKDLASNVSSYYNQQFQSYSEHSSNDIDLSFSSTLSDTPANAYQEMLKEMEKINQIIQNEKSIESLPMLGQSIPELLEYSTKPRVDDDQEFDQPNSRLKQSEPHPQEELESLRVNLQLIFGVENVIYAYHTVEEKIMKEGLALDQQQTIEEILQGRPEIDESLLQAYFRVIVTIVGMEMRLL